MQRDLLDALRCPGDHDESWLVAMVHVAVGSDLRDAELACPVCGAEYRVTEGVAHFAAATVRPEPGTHGDADPLMGDMVVRLAALLGVSESRHPVALFGRYAAASAALAAMVEAPQLLVNAGPGPVAAIATHLYVGDRLPFGAHTLAAVAVDATHATGPMLASAAHALRVGGRLVAPADASLPSGMRELARDAHEWVAETTARANGLVELRRHAP
jgi:uncharacterized protein YbaR (Trm112 family)